MDYSHQWLVAQNFQCYDKAGKPFFTASVATLIQQKGNKQSLHTNSTYTTECTDSLDLMPYVYIAGCTWEKQIVLDLMPYIYITGCTRLKTDSLRLNALHLHHTVY